MPKYASVHMLLPERVLAHKLVSKVRMYASSLRLMNTMYAYCAHTQTLQAGHAVFVISISFCMNNLC